MPQAILFHNFSDEDFTYTYDSVSYTFPAHSDVMIQDYLHGHFTKHLVNRELQKGNYPFIGKQRDEMMLKTIGGETIEADSEAQIEIEMMNDHSCKDCDFVGKTSGGLKTHARIHNEFEGIEA